MLENLFPKGFQKNFSNMKILGIDPGYERLGIAILERNRGDKKETLLYSACFKTPKTLPFSERLLLLGTKIEKVIAEFSPGALATENLFLENNQKTAMHVAEVRGALIFLAAKNNMQIFEYTPLQVKQAVAGHGGGDKKQVEHMVHQLVRIEKEIAHDDEYDAIAIGLTCFARERLL